MAAAQEALQEVQREVTCGICRSYFSQLVTIECGHSFCQGCLSQTWRVEASVFSCPDCGQVTQVREFPGVNEHLAQLTDLGKQLSCQLFQGTEGQKQRATHKEVLKFFCEEEGCCQTPEHGDHTLSPVEETAHNYREKFQHIQSPLGKHFEESEKSPAQEETSAGDWECKITGECSERWKFLPEDGESQCLERLEQEQWEDQDRLSHQRPDLHHLLPEHQGGGHQTCEDDKELGARSHLVSPSQYISPGCRMTLGTRTPGKRDSGYLPWFLRQKQEEEQVYLLHHPQLEEEKENEGEEEQLQTSDPQDEAREMEAPFFCSLSMNYQPLKEQPDEEKLPKKLQKLQKYGKNLGKVITKGCQYFFIGLEGFAKAYETPFGTPTAFLSLAPRQESGTEH